MIRYSTRNDLPPDVRARIVTLCNARLADSIDLEAQLKHAHWNVKGPTFIALHRLFDEVHEQLEEFVDLIAERVVQLGGVAAGTIRLAAQASQLDEYPPDAASGAAHVEAVADLLATYGQATRGAIDEADRVGDKTTADLFTEVSRAIDKCLWLVEAQLHVDA
jgi:starvation-inducible DNA-binding protein